MCCVYKLREHLCAVDLAGHQRHRSTCVPPIYIFFFYCNVARNRLLYIFPLLSALFFLDYMLESNQIKAIRGLRANFFSFSSMVVIRGLCPDFFHFLPWQYICYDSIFLPQQYVFVILSAIVPGRFNSALMLGLWA